MKTDRKNEKSRSEFYQERRIADIQATHQLFKATAQMAILINGGAATAILASQSEIIKKLLNTNSISLSLIFYSSGVFCGMFVHFFHRQSIHRWGCYWEDRADGNITRSILNNIYADDYNNFSNIAFFLSCTFFAIGCLTIAKSLF